MLRILATRLKSYPTRFTRWQWKISVGGSNLSRCYCFVRFFHPHILIFLIQKILRESSIFFYCQISTCRFRSVSSLLILKDFKKCFNLYKSHKSLWPKNNWSIITLPKWNSVQNNQLFPINVFQRRQKPFLKGVIHINY